MCLRRSLDPANDQAMAVPLSAPITPMIAVTAKLPVGEEWAYEPKWDGFRAVAFRRENRVDLQSRSLKPLGTYFPEITRAIRAAVGPGVVLDGELIVWDDARERSSFALLQRRISAGRHVNRYARRWPAHYVVFDLLADGSRSLLGLPLRERRRRLEQILARARNEVVLTPQTADLDVVREWIETWTETGIEGVVAKRLDRPYRPGQRGWRKHRTRSTTEAIVGGVTGWLSAPQTVLVGRLDSRGQLRYVGRSTPLTDAQRTELAQLLSRPVAQRRGAPVQHPWPQPLPASWSGQWERREPVRYVQVEPEIVAEILVDTAFEHSRFRHRVKYVRPRGDMSIYDVPILGADE
jgi:ATP-dependent DNA ligase